MKLCALSEPVRAALQREDISTAVALLIARIPDATLQEQALEQVGDRTYGEAMNADEASLLIEDKFMHRLGDAPFDRTMDDLVEGAGACSTCCHRTGNQRELFSDVDSPDVCTNPPCWEAKKKAGWALTKAAAEAQGSEGSLGQARRRRCSTPTTTR